MLLLLCYVLIQVLLCPIRYSHAVPIYECEGMDEERMMFWNTLDDEASIVNSEVGPNIHL